MAQRRGLKKIVEIVALKLRGRPKGATAATKLRGRPPKEAAGGGKKETKTVTTAGKPQGRPKGSRAAAAKPAAKKAAAAPKTDGEVKRARGRPKGGHGPVRDTARADVGSGLLKRESDPRGVDGDEDAPTDSETRREEGEEGGRKELSKTDTTGW